MNRLQTITISAALAAALGTAALAQGPGGGGFQPSPQMMAKFQAWGKWRQSHPHISSLQQALRGLATIESDPKTRLSKAQATKVLPILTAWQHKPVMTDGQAAQVIKKLTAPLTASQLKVIAAESQRRGGFGGGRPGGPGGPGGRPGGPGGPGGRPGGPGGPGGRPGGFTMPDPHDYNPLNPDTLPFERMRDRMKESLSMMIAQLKTAK